MVADHNHRHNHTKACSSHSVLTGLIRARACLLRQNSWHPKPIHFLNHKIHFVKMIRATPKHPWPRKQASFKESSNPRGVAMGKQGFSIFDPRPPPPSGTWRTSGPRHPTVSPTPKAVPPGTLKVNHRHRPCLGPNSHKMARHATLRKIAKNRNCF